VTLEKLRGRLLISLALGALIFLALTAYGDFSDVFSDLGSFRWQYLPIVLSLTSANYILRFLKWEYYLRKIGVADLPRAESALAYLSGLGMVVTPGRVGEWLKCYLVRELHGTPFSKTAPILIAERLTDSLGLVVLGAAGLFAFGDAWPVFVAMVAVCALIVLFARHRPLAKWVLHHLERVPIARRFAEQAEDFYDSSYALLGPRELGSMTLLSVLSWGFEVLAFYVVLLGLGLGGGADLLLRASFIMSVATLAGALLLTPGGLGVAEGGITGLSQVLVDLSKSAAAVGALVIRFGTLWFGVIVGLVALVIVSRRLGPSSAAAAAAPAGEGAGAT
jgi:uncharacterized protein (TIRG00374 family)